MNQLTIYDQTCIGSDSIFPSCSSCACGAFNCLYSTSGRCEGKCTAQNCKGGMFYPTVPCKRFVEYTDSAVKDCLKAVVQIYQDGYISCSLIDNIGCEECYKEYERNINNNGT